MNELIKWDKIRTEIETAKDIEVLLGLKDKLRAYQILAEQSRQSVEVQAKIAIYKARADRKCGEWLKENIEHGGDRKTESRSNVATLKDLDLTKSESSRLQKIAEIPEKKFEDILVEAEIEVRKITNNMLVKIAKEIEKEERVDDEYKERVSEKSKLEIRKGDFKEVLADLCEIDAIITDPPYPHQYINCFSELSFFCKEHLKQNGFAAIYSGQYHLPEVIKKLSENLTYVWTFCLYHVGQKQIINYINVMCGWKPVLIFSNGNKKMPFSAYDVLISEKREKSEHEWQQSETGVENLIEIFSKPGELVVDPFSGSGTFGLVSQRMGRNFIGAEIL